MGASILITCSLMATGQIIAVIARITPTLKMLDPTALPTARSPWSIKAALRLTTSSGELVPKATTVRPTMSGVSPRRSAMEELPRTRPSAPIVRIASEAMIKIKFSAIGSKSD